MKIKLIVEDFYGVEFLKKVIERLKETSLVNKNLIIPKPKHLPADCNKKLEEILEMFDNTCDRIIIVLDGDGPQNYGDRLEKAQSHVSNSMVTPVKIVLAEYEIEEWICISKNLKWKHSKPSEELKTKEGYEKYKLPKYASELNFGELQKKSKSFNDFLNALTPITKKH